MYDNKTIKGFISNKGPSFFVVVKMGFCPKQISRITLSYLRAILGVGYIARNTWLSSQEIYSHIYMAICPEIQGYIAVQYSYIAMYIWLFIC